MSTPLEQWVESVARMTRPANISGATGRRKKRPASRSNWSARATRFASNEKTYPNCYLHRSDPSDVARTEKVTFICTRDRENAGPTNNWMAPAEAKQTLGRLFEGSMKDRTMYVVPYIMGPSASPQSRIGVEVTDSAYVVASMRIMSRMGKVALDRLGSSSDFVPGLHSLGDLQSRPPLHRALPRRKIDLEHWLGIRRECAAREEMFCAAHRELDGARAGLDGRTHAHPGTGIARRKSDVHGRGIPERLRQNESGHDGFGAGKRRLPRVDRGRRHRLDADRRGRLPARDQSRGRILWRRSGHERKNQSECDDRAPQKYDFHEYGHDSAAANPGGKAWTATLPRTCWIGRDASGILERPRGAGEFAVHGAGRASAVDFSALGRSRRRTDLRVYFWRPPRAPGSAGLRSDQLAARRVRGRDDGFGNHRGHNRSGGRNAARPHGHASLLRLQHGRLFRTLAGNGPRTFRIRRKFST